MKKGEVVDVMSRAEGGKVAKKRVRNGVKACVKK